MSDLPTPLDVLDFWWKAGPERWFAKDDAFDDDCTARFGKLHAEAAAGRLDGWQDTPEGALALIVVLDQFSRNMFRDTPKAFAQDARALAVADAALKRGFDRAFPLSGRQFFYMPFMHAEDIAAQERCVDLFRELGDKDGDYYALLHLDAIRRFGRFPHRNRILGRDTTEAETRYLESGGFTG